ncbi:MAG: CvpA family protein [Gammaproteobacteria bacterium]|nr:CvpA family protein [Gammaproteobacteria bacterium]MDH5593216.1 CvpA family protein [Gammaproteobacteria bacterium]
MVWIDYAIIGIIIISAIISLFRGFAKEALSLAVWILAIWVALTFSNHVAALMQDLISIPSVRITVAFSILFVATIILGSIINYFVGKLVTKSGLTGTDRMLGALFGIARGGVIVVIIVLLAGMTALPRDNWWKQSLLLPYAQQSALFVRGFLPDSVSKNIVY